ncbi:TrmH family RNA methyltransferase [Nocardioides sp. Kera G14]|uniref:TrmH family RNA methyltransferase n=1 Tax=Nocardioides sp. Kera G14 TaxID=2884264 RepID=UPI001D11A780|nr:RNA methyltransferase [Nocardioides sp. Kera G14]UDY25151.1 RNA methyltransferase [Nocardioides sp. Kera G14]
MATFIEISDPADARLSDYRDLRDVQLRTTLEVEHGLFLAEGEKVVRRAVEGGFTPRSFLMAPKWLAGLADALATTDAPCYVMPERTIEDVTGFHVHRGALASLVRKPLPALADVVAGARRVAVLENLIDHANVGAAFRNAAGLGVDAVLITEACADPYYRRAIKTSMGNVFNVSWTRARGMEDILSALRDGGFTTAALTLADGSISLDALAARRDERLALVFGTEGAGVDPRTEKQVDLCVTIPMEPGVDSLNVAAATAVAFYATRVSRAGA